MKIYNLQSAFIFGKIPSEYLERISTYIVLVDGHFNETGFTTQDIFCIPIIVRYCDNKFYILGTESIVPSEEILGYIPIVSRYDYTVTVQSKT